MMKELKVLPILFSYSEFLGQLPAGFQSPERETVETVSLSFANLTPG
jgi:hypothetical protein